MRKSTDTVPAMLTKGEAVMNRNAAELLGRDTIKRLNDHGNMLSKRGVDLAGLQSDPTPGPSTENMLGYQMGTSMVQGDDRADLLKDAENTFYGGGTAPVPTPTPTPPTRGYAYGTEDVDPLKRKTTGAGRTFRRVDASNPVSTSQYMGMGGALLGPQYDQSGGVNPLPKGAVGVQGFAQTFNQNLNGSTPASSGFTNQRPKTPSEMAADIARRNLTSVGSQLGTPQQTQQQVQSGFMGYVSPEDAGSQNLQWTGGNTGWQSAQYTGGTNIPSQQDQPTVHFLPPGFTATTGSTGTPNSSPNDIHFLPPGFTSVQGVTNPQTKQLQQPDDQGYGSAYGY